MASISNRLGRGVLFLGVVGLTACGGEGSSPVAASPTTSSIAVTVGSPLKVGATTQAAATASLSNGTTQPLATGWKSDNAAVATVTDAGLVTGVGNGGATIYVISGGRQGQQVLRVLPDYQGSWVVGYRITACSQNGAFATANFCQGEVGANGRATMMLTQAGEAVAGQFTLRLGGSEVPFVVGSAPIGSDGATEFTATGNDSGFVIASTWTINQATRGVWTGTTREVWTFPGVSGQAVFEATISSTAKTARDNGQAPGRPHAPTPRLTD